VGTGLSDRLNQNGRITDQLLDNGVVSHLQPLGGGMNLVYRSDTDPAVIIPVHTFLASGTSTPDSINAKLTIGGVDSGTVQYNVTGLTTGVPLRFNLLAFPSSASSGMYDWSVEVNLVYSGSTVTKTFTGQEAIVNRRDSVFGAGWWLDGLDRLYTSSAGALLANGDGTTHWYAKSGSVWLQAEGDLSYSTLTEASGVYTLTDKWGDTRVFNSSGYLTSVKRLNNNVATYSFTYNGSNKLTKITDEFSREYTFTYNGSSGLLETATDFFGRESSLTHSSGRLTEITITEETYSGYTAPTWAFTYTNISPQYLLSQVTLPGGSAIEYVFDSTSRRLKEIKNADHTTGSPSLWKLYPAIAEGLHVTGSTIAVPKVSDMNPRYVNELNNTFSFKTGRFGDVVSFTDALSATTTFDIDPWGQVYRITAADPDGGGSQTSPVTKYGFNSSGDLVITVHPDGNNIRAAYHSTLHLPTTVWNELNETQVMEYYSNGNLDSWTDESGNTWEYTWDTHGNLLTETSPDPDGAGSLAAIVTTREYHSTYYYRQTKFTHGDGNYRTWAWNSHDEISSETNELGQTTSWTFDPLGRVRTKTLPDPDGAGSQSAPVYSWTYGSNLLVATATDPLSNVTSWSYDNRHRLIELTLPDPDGAGSLTAPEYTWTYNKISLVTAETRPEFNGVSIAYTWDANGQVTESSGPVSNQDTAFEYDLLGRLIETTAASGRVIKRTYDSRRRLTSIIDHDPDGAGSLTGPTETYAYNAASQLTSVTDALGRVTSFAWSDTGWLTSKTMPDPDGSGSASAPVYTWTHDTLGRKTKSTDGAARETSYTWNSRHLVTRVTEPDPDGTGPGNNLTATYTDYAYDAGARLTSVTRWGSRVTSYSYDHLDRLLSTTLPDPDGAGPKSSPVYSQTFDAVGNILTKTDALSHATTYTFDNLYRLKTITEQDPDGAGALSSPVWTYAYNNYNQLSSITNPMSHVTSFGYL
jgi:YD repeat-containing protein